MGLLPASGFQSKELVAVGVLLGSGPAANKVHGAGALEAPTGEDN